MLCIVQSSILSIAWDKVAYKCYIPTYISSRCWNSILKYLLFLSRKVTLNTKSAHFLSKTLFIPIFKLKYDRDISIYITKPIWLFFLLCYVYYMKSNDKFKKPKRAFTARYIAPSRNLRKVCSIFTQKDKFCIGKIDSNCLNKGSKEWKYLVQ